MSKENILHYSRQETIAPLSSWFENLLDQCVDQGLYPDQNALEDTATKLERELKAYSKKFNIHNVVIGLSGGVDSALTAALFKAAKWNVQAYTLPILQNPAETDRALETADALNIPITTIDLTDTYRNLIKDFKQFDDDITLKTAKIRSANLRVRLRMMTLYNMASKLGGLVASTDNFSELAAGFWTLHGDVGDLAPIQSLSKSWEVPKTAEIYGVPQSTVLAKPTDGLGISNGDEDQFGFSYLEFDLVLLSLCHSKQTLTDVDGIQKYLNTDPADQTKVLAILKRISNSVFKRNNPCNLTHPLFDSRFQGLQQIDKILKQDR